MTSLPYLTFNSSHPAHFGKDYTALTITIARWLSRCYHRDVKSRKTCPVCRIYRLRYPAHTTIHFPLCSRYSFVLQKLGSKTHTLNKVCCVWSNSSPSHSYSVTPRVFFRYPRDGTSQCFHVTILSQDSHGPFFRSGGFIVGNWEVGLGYIVIMGVLDTNRCKLIPVDPN